VSAPDARRPEAAPSVAPPARGGPETSAIARPAAVRRDAAPRIPAGLGREQLLELFYFMRLTRSLEERLTNLYRQGKVIGGLFRSLGQEADSVGSAYALDRSAGDFLSPLIRNLGSLLVMGVRPVEVLRQYMAKATSPTRGRELNVHFGDLDRGFLGQISHLGDMVPVMAGITLTFRMRGQARVGLVYVGDGAMSTGAFHEGMNLASVWKAPVVFICENNLYALFTSNIETTSVRDIADRAQGYGMPGVIVDGNDAIGVYEAAREAIQRARSGQGPTFIESKTYRIHGHTAMDRFHLGVYRAKEEVEEWEKKDPVRRLRQRLIEMKAASEAELKKIDEQARLEMEEAEKFSKDSPYPTREEIFQDVYVD
jgi:TPP-dependent pyruvate/acetoin dehydrogenase alpha subunit